MQIKYPIHELLKKYWGYDSFRPLQEEIILSTLDGKDTLAILPTGGGKSICYQVPALASEGICIVVSPLIALMKDQSDQLKKRGIPSAVIHSGLHPREIDIVLDNCIYGGIKLLYVSPERLSSEIFIERAKSMNINLLAVDEAHCISEWGYDFRPAYLQIKVFRDLIKPKRNLALTASATEDVRQDIITHLAYSNTNFFQKSFHRENLSYSCLLEHDKEKKLEEILKNVPGSSIIYVRNRRKTVDIANILLKKGISADFYHAGLTFDDRSKKQDRWIQNKTRVMVATNAFGMGIDKPDVRTVIHIDLTNSIEAYYQEAGRAGRDGKRAYAVILYDEKEIERLVENTVSNFPGFHMIRHVYQSLITHLRIVPNEVNDQFFDFDLATFVKKYQLDSKKTFAAIKILEQEGVLQFNESFFSPSKLFIPVDNKRLYEFQVANANYDIFIKSVLRVYGGELFSHFVPIDEKQLADRLNITLEDTKFRLGKLTTLGIFNFSPQKETPQILLHYTGPIQTLPISEKNIKAKHERETARISSVESYVNNDIACRSALLCMYFGELEAKDCGICDHCLEKKRKAAQFEKINSCKTELLAFLGNREKIEIEILPDHFRSYPKEIVLNAVRELLEEKKIFYPTLTEISLSK